MRTLPLDPETARMLREFIASGSPVSQGGKPLLFGISRFRAWQVVRDTARKAGLEQLINPETGRRRGVSPNRLRDAFATHAAGMDSSPEGLKLLQEHLGHHSMDQTARYIKVATGKQRDWFERLWQKKQ